MAQLQILLDEDENLLSNSHISTISGSVKLSAAVAIDNLLHLQLRFVGAVVVKSERKTPEKFSFDYIGSSRLFDKVIVLSESRALDAGEYRFPFQLALPPGSPQSIHHERVIVEYLLVAVLSFRNGCFGLIPFLQKKPLLVKQVIPLVSQGLEKPYLSRVKEIGDIIGDFVFVFASEKVLVQIKPLQWGSFWTVLIHVHKSLDLLQVTYALEQGSMFKYRFEFLDLIS
jgi:hypothetical protein